MVKDLLAGEKIPVIAGPILSDRSKPELRNQSVENPGQLAGEGILTALCTDHPVIPIQYLSLCAGIAIGNGMEREAALKAITISAAKAAGIDRRVGSLAVGKDADFVVFDGDPCSPYVHPEMVFINGQRILW